MRIQFLQRKNIFKLSLVIIISLLSVLVLVGLFLRSGEALQEIWMRVQLAPLLLTIPIFVASSLLTGFIWGNIMNGLGVTIPLHQHIWIYLATAFWGRLPGGIWHVVGRVTAYERLGVPKRLTTFASLLQWFLIIYSGILTSLLLLPFVFNTSTLRHTLVYILIISLVLGLLLHPNLLTVVVRRFVKTLPSLELRMADLAVWLFLYLIIWLLGGTILHLVLVSFSIQNLFLPFSLLTWCVGNISGIIVTFLPSGLGLTEATTSILLATQSQIPSSIGVLSSLLIRLLLTIFDFVLSIFSIFVLRLMRLPLYNP